MSRLPRPHVPLSIQCKVAMRQLWISGVDMEHILVRFRGRLGPLKEVLLVSLADKLGCERSALQLDHDPPLGAREQIRRNGKFIRYKPDANDPKHLVWRDKESHRVKTLIRGEHGQYSDLALIKRERRRNRTGIRPTKTAIAKRKKAKTSLKLKWRWPKRKFASRRKP